MILIKGGNKIHEIYIHPLKIPSNPTTKQKINLLMVWIHPLKTMDGLSPSTLF